MTFTTNLVSRRTDYCSLACIQRSPCQLCGTIITGRAKFQGGERRFCSRRCASIVNRTLASKIAYEAFAFAGAIKRRGHLCCERCAEADEAVLVAHHVDGDRRNNAPENLETLCANCHFREHFGRGPTRQRRIETARYLAHHL